MILALPGLLLLLLLLLLLDTAAAMSLAHPLLLPLQPAGTTAAGATPRAGGLSQPAPAPVSPLLLSEAAEDPGRVSGRRSSCLQCSSQEQRRRSCMPSRCQQRRRPLMTLTLCCRSSMT